MNERIYDETNNLIRTCPTCGTAIGITDDLMSDLFGGGMDNLDSYLDSCDCTKCSSLRTIAEKLYPPVCSWEGRYSQMINGVKYWDSACRRGILAEPRHEWKFCPYCGRKIEVKP